MTQKGADLGITVYQVNPPKAKSTYFRERADLDGAGLFWVERAYLVHETQGTLPGAPPFYSVGGVAVSLGVE